jgi:hypothetical protein
MVEDERVIQFPQQGKGGDPYRNTEADGEPTGTHVDETH